MPAPANPTSSAVPCFTLRKVCFLAVGLSAALYFQPVHAQADAAKSIPMAKRIVLVVDEIHALRNFPVVLAERLGYLQDGDMAVTVMNVRYDIWHGDMLMDGRVDAVMAYYHHNIVNHAQGRATEAIVTLGLTPGMKVMVANAVQGKYKSVSDLKGAKIITGGAGSSKTTVANALLIAGGHQISDYTRLGTEGKQQNVAALRSGAAELVVAPVPEGDFYEAQGVASTFADLTSTTGTVNGLGALFPSNTVFMATERVKEHPEIAQHLASAFVRTLKYINSHSAEELAELVPVEIRGKDKPAYVKLLQAQMPMFASDGNMPAAGAQMEWNALAAASPKYKSVALELTYSNRFVTQALTGAQ